MWVDRRHDNIIQSPAIPLHSKKKKVVIFGWWLARHVVAMGFRLEYHKDAHAWSSCMSPYSELEPMLFSRPKWKRKNLFFLLCSILIPIAHPEPLPVSEQLGNLLLRRTKFHYCYYVMLPPNHSHMIKFFPLTSGRSAFAARQIAFQQNIPSLYMCLKRSAEEVGA